ncbi:MAG: family 43 glycosylhydrolase [Epulopiscium sp.]|nr:family 43 glycosylhydrolase [Candidatus Epulonipiscium sp.]
MKNSEINIRDPFVLAFEGKYYMYGTRGATCWGPATGFDVYVGTDLENWSDPIEIFHTPEGFWADRNYWAPEVHYYKENFYLFATFKAEGQCRGTQILKSASPIGPFKIHSEGPVTPRDWECLDGTLYIDKNGTPHMIFCHEWVQVQDGKMYVVELSKDLKRAIGKPRLLFSASEALWSVAVKDGSVYVTDGPFLYRCTHGDLLMIWSSFSKGGYGVGIAKSDNGEITGNWLQEENLLFKKNGGHGMIFKSFDEKLFLALHTPNEHLAERPVFFELVDRNNRLYQKE